MARLAHEASHRLRGEYRCEVCDRVFSLPQSLGAHQKVVHGISKKGKPKSNGSHKEAAIERLQPEPKQIPEKVPVGIEAEIKAAFTPLIDRYTSLQARTRELQLELEQNEKDLRELWSVLAAAPVAQGLTPPLQEAPPGVHVAFEKRVSDHLRQRFVEYLSSRKNSFTAPDVSRSLGVSQSTSNKLIVDFRDEGKIRLIGRRGRALSYVSTIFNAR